jgi:hypothetical protein
LNPERDRIFMVAVRDPSGATDTLEVPSGGNPGEAALIRELVARVKAADPDAIENHNLHGFDLPVLTRRAQILGMPLALGRIRASGLRVRTAKRGYADVSDSRRVRYVAPGRELIDTMDAVLRYDFATRQLQSHGLKAVARHLGVARPDREQIRGSQVYTVYLRDPERVRHMPQRTLQRSPALPGCSAALHSRWRKSHPGNTSGLQTPEPLPASLIRFWYRHTCALEWRCRHTRPAMERLTAVPRCTCSQRESRIGS